ncbi:MAG: amidase [Alphaproteobacteria bacterium]|nr:amidase [Alphaproteobacteria bacterium]
MEIHEMGALELSAAFARHEVSPVEAAQSCLARIAAFDARINAFCHLDDALSLAQAEASQERWMAGAPLSPLDGVPVAIKDLLLTKGWPTRRGSRTVDPNGPWLEDAPSVARLREAGAVLIGKTTTPEFGWKGCTDSPLTGVTRNPWDLTKTPGGSSGGSAAAVAARLCPLALGTDGGGSIRIPASFTGTFGLKPSFGRVAAWPLSPFGTLAHVGPMSRSVRDSALLMNVLARSDARDWYGLPPSSDDYLLRAEASLKGKRIAYSPRLGYVTKVVPEVESLVEKAVQRFEQMGARVERVDPPGGNPSEIFRTLWWAGAAYLLADLPEEKKALLEVPLRRMAEEGAGFALKDYMAANLQRGAYGAGLRQFMESYDFLVTPSLATPAFETERLTPLDDDGNAWMAWTPFSFPFNLTQQPAASINCGFTRDGLPVGVQIVGRMYDDGGVLAASLAYERADPDAQKSPPGY